MYKHPGTQAGVGARPQAAGAAPAAASGDMQRLRSRLQSLLALPLRAPLPAGGKKGKADKGGRDGAAARPGAASRAGPAARPGSFGAPSAPAAIAAACSTRTRAACSCRGPCRTLARAGPKKIGELSKDTATGVSILKGQTDPPIKPDNEYPPWLFKLLETEQTVVELQRTYEGPGLTLTQVRRRCGLLRGWLLRGWLLRGELLRGDRGAAHRVDARRRAAQAAALRRGAGCCWAGALLALCRRSRRRHRLLMPEHCAPCHAANCCADAAVVALQEQAAHQGGQHAAQEGLMSDERLRHSGARRAAAAERLPRRRSGRDVQCWGSGVRC